MVVVSRSLCGSQVSTPSPALLCPLVHPRSSSSTWNVPRTYPCCTYPSIRILPTNDLGDFSQLDQLGPISNKKNELKKQFIPKTHKPAQYGHTKVAKKNDRKKRPWYLDTVHQEAFYEIEKNALHMGLCQHIITMMNPLKSTPTLLHSSQFQ